MTAVQLAGASIVPDHDLIERIGRGGYGEVWLARNRTTNTPRAVKIVFRHEFEDERPYQREFEGLLKFEPISRSHPSQLAILHVGRNDEAGCFYYVMELADAVRSEIPGVRKPETGEVISYAQLPDRYAPRTLHFEFKTRGRLPATEVIDLGRALATALDHLHRHGLVHRDIKPANIVYVGGMPKLADIGLVTDASDACSIVGTEGYIPPEGPGAPQADLYSFGKVLYEAATGRDRRDYPALPNDFRCRSDAKLLAELNAVILHACTRDLRKRYRSANQVRADLDLLSSGRSVRRQVTRRTVTQLAVCGVLLAAVVASGWWIAAYFADRPAARNELVFETSGTKNRDAWTEFQKGQFFNKKFTADGVSNAIQSFERAIAIDPNYVFAYLSLADALTDAPFVGLASSRESYPKAETFLRKAVQLDPTNAEALALLGRVKVIYGFGVIEGEQLLLRALSFDANNLTALLNLSMCASWMGRGSEAVMYARRAQQLDPTSVGVNRNLGHRLFEVRRYDEAIEQLRKTLELHQNHADILRLLAITYEQRGQTNEAYDAYLKAKIAAGTSEEELRQCKADFKEVGLAAFWRCSSPAATNSWRPKYPIAGTYNCVHTGDYDSAIRWAELAFDDPLDLVKIKSYPCWDPLRKDPRFQELIHRFEKRAGLGALSGPH